MSSLFHATAHGLVANNRIVFSNIVPDDCGLDPSAIYYVLAAGLTANDFAVSLTSGGAAITLLLPVTSCTVSYADTYVAITNPVDPMAPPPAMPTPGSPTLSSDTATGVVRLMIQLPLDSPDVTVRSVQVYTTDKYFAAPPSTPDFGRADLRVVPYGAGGFNMRAHPLHWYSTQLRYIDTFGNVGPWSAVIDHQTVDGYDSLTAVLSAQAKLLDHKIGTVEIANGAITADLLAAQIILGGTIIAGIPPGQHVELDSAGVRLLDPLNNTVVNMPTDSTQPVSVTGNITAGTLTSITAAEFRTAASLAAGAAMTVQSGVAAPASAPVLVSGYEAIKSGVGNSNDWGLAWDGTYICKPRLGFGAVPVAVYIDRYTTAGVLHDTITTDITTSSLLDGLAADGTSYYMLFYNSGAASVSIRKVNGSGTTTASATITADISGSKPGCGGLFWDATTSRLVVTTTTNTTATAQFRFRLYNSSLALQSTVDATGLAVDATSLISIPGAARVGTDYWVQGYGTDANARAVHSFTASTGANIANTDWGYKTGGAGYIIGAGLAYDGTNFYFHDADISAIEKATNWTWTTASSKYWVCYSWYDPDVTTHETVVGPRASITMFRRQRLSVTSATIPGAGGADDPDNVRIYMKPNATDPGAGAFKLQATDALTQRYLIDYASGGAADGGGLAFPAATAATIASAGAGWILRGNGLINRVGTAFPTPAVAGDSYVRSDLDYVEFVYDGTRWLSRQLFVMDQTDGGLRGAAVTSTSAYMVPMIPWAGSDLWLVDHAVKFIVGAGTALDAANKWVGTIKKRDVNNADLSTLVTVNIISGSLNVWRTSSTAAIDALWSAVGASFAVVSTWTKTGTPGPLTALDQITYRLVAT